MRGSGRTVTVGAAGWASPLVCARPVARSSSVDPLAQRMNPLADLLERAGDLEQVGPLVLERDLSAASCVAGSTGGLEVFVQEQIGTLARGDDVVDAVGPAGAAWPSDLADVAVSLEDGSTGLLPGTCAVAPVAHVSSANGDDPAGRAVPGRRAPVELPHVSDYDNARAAAETDTVTTPRLQLAPD